MRALSPKVILAKNSLGSGSVFTFLLDIIIPDTEIIRITLNGESIFWRGFEYKSVLFEIDKIGESSTGEIPQLKLKITNISGIFDDYIAQYDAYLKANGIYGNQVKTTLSLVNTEDLTSGIPVREEHYTLISPSITSQWATFTLGADSPLENRCPARRIFKNHCDFKLGSAECGYVGLETQCGKTLADCLAIGNNLRYGGFAGAGHAGVSM